MSRDLFPTVKSKKHVQIITDSEVMRAILNEAVREQRSLSYVVSRILEKYYEDRARLKVV